MNTIQPAGQPPTTPVPGKLTGPEMMAAVGAGVVAIGLGSLTGFAIGKLARNLMAPKPGFAVAHSNPYHAMGAPYAAPYTPAGLPNPFMHVRPHFNHSGDERTYIPGHRQFYSSHR